MEHIVVNDTITEITSGDGDFKAYTRSVTIAAAVCAIIFSIVGVLGNLVTVIALLKYTRLRRHATTAFVISLSISDLIFSAVNLPLTASRYLNEAWILGDTLCQLFPLFFYGNVAVSLLSMVAITINRYASVLGLHVEVGALIIATLYVALPLLQQRHPVYIISPC